MNYYERYLGGYAKKTGHLELAGHGAYTLMLDTYYSTEKPLPADYAALYRICRAIEKAEQGTVRKVADEFFPVGSDGLRHNERADAEIAKAQKRISTARANGAKAAGHSGGDPDSDPGGGPKSTPSGPPSGPHMVKPPDPMHHLSPSDKPGGRARAAKSRLAPDWSLPAEWRAWALTERQDWNEATVIRISLIFRDHWLGKGEARADWQATWRGWVRRERALNGKHQTLAERRSENMADITGRTKNERTIDPDPVGGTPIREAIGDLRESHGNDVGGLPKGGSHGRVV
jgi:uncharacterized protein YdaU (DUF1376 family)